MEERIVYLMFGSENTRKGMISELKYIKTFIQLPAEQAKLQLYNRVLNRVCNMTDGEFETVMQNIREDEHNA